MRCLFGSIVMLLSCFLSFCCIHACNSDSGSDGDGGDGMDDGQTQDAGDGGGDFTDGGSDKADLGIPVQCSCRNPEDELVNVGERPMCKRSNYTCNALNPCDEGYFCWGECECQDLDICGIDCSSGCYCPSPLECDPNTNTCRAPLGCLDDSMCPDEEVCREVYEGPDDRVDYHECTTPSGAGTGQPCDYNWQCRSGVCYTQICLQFCTQNSDCPQGQYCELVDHGSMACVVATGCNPACALPDEYCYGLPDPEPECRSDFCRTGADCPGDCELPYLYSNPRIGRCAEISVCSDEEFVLGIYANTRCMIYQACWTDIDCEQPYECITLSPGVYLIGFCGRWIE